MFNYTCIYIYLYIIDTRTISFHVQTPVLLQNLLRSSSSFICNSTNTTMTDPSLFTSITSWFTPTTLFLFINLVIGTIVVTSRFTSHKKPQINHEYQLGSYDSPPLARAPSLIDRVKSINFSLYKFPSPEEHPSFDQPTAETEHLYNTGPVDPNPPQLARAPSLLERVKSNLFSYKFPNPEEHPPFVEPTEPLNDAFPADPKPTRIERVPSLLERVKSIRLPSVYRSQEPYPEVETEVIHNSETEVASDPGHKPKRSKSETKKSKQKVQENMKKSVSEKSIKVETDNDETETVEERRPQTTRLERTATIGDGDQSVDAKADDFINKFRRQLKLQRLDSLLRYKEMLKGK